MFCSGRSILAHTTLLRDTLDSIERTNEPAILSSLDQEKTFHRVSRSFLLELLPSPGFSPSFCRWVTTLYSGANMRIILNDWLTTQIPLERGVRQGDPLSPLLYVLFVEILPNLIRTCPQIEGFLLPGSSGYQAKVCLYADDTTTILKDFRSLTRLFDCVSIYERSTGAKLNKSKTEAMWLGAWKSRTDEPLGLTWVHKMKILGVLFGSIPTEVDNWQPKINKLEKSLNLRRLRSLSLPGKALITNVLGLSKLLYLARVLVLPAWVISRVNALIGPFLWGSQLETVSRNTCFLSPRLGGLGLCNCLLKCCALSLAGLATTLDSPGDSSFFLCKYFVGRRLSSLCPCWLFLRDNSAPCTSSPTPFYNTCLQTLCNIGDSELFSKKIYLKLLSSSSSSLILSRHWAPFVGRRFSLDCSRVKRVWQRFVPCLSPLLGTQFVCNVLLVFFFRWPGVTFKLARIPRYLVKSILYGVWLFRNKATFHNGHEVSKAIIRFVLDDITHRIQLDHFRLSDNRFSGFWVADNFCSIQDGLLYFDI